MPKPELLKSSTALVPISLTDNEVQRVVSRIKELAEVGDLEDAIRFCSELLFDSPFAARSSNTKRYVLKRLWDAIDEYLKLQQEKRLKEQVWHLSSYERESKEYADSAEDDAMEDMRQSLRFERRIARAEILFETMHKDPKAFTPMGFDMLANLLTQSEDGA